MLKRLQNFHYHRELIQTLVDTKLGAVATNIIAPIVFFLLFPDIPVDLLYYLTAAFFVVFVFRISTGSSLRKKLYTADDETIENGLKKYLFVLFLSSSLWAIAAVLAIIYSDTMHIFILLTGMIAIISGATATIGSVYHAMFIYIVTIIPAFVFGLAYLGFSPEYYITSFFLLLYMFVMLTSSFKNYNILENSITQKNEIELLNKSLEKRVEIAVEDTKQKEKLLLHQSHMAQMGEMLGMIAHQWRQPLSSISSAVVGLQVKLELESFDLKDEKGVKSLVSYLTKHNKDVAKYVKFLSTTIDDFRSFFKPNKSKQFVKLTTPIIKTLEIIEASLLNKNIKLVKEFHNDEKVSLYKNEMMQVILNILKNSEENFLDKGIEDGKITISTEKSDGKYIISIKDNGGGIPKDILPDIFTPYFSTKYEKNGTGLGLYMSKTIIEKHHNGILRAINTEDGVNFEIIINAKVENDGAI